MTFIVIIPASQLAKLAVTTVNMSVDHDCALDPALAWDLRSSLFCANLQG